MTTKEKTRFSHIQRILVGILALNWGVALAKLIYGITHHINSMTADGFHSFADGTSNIIGLIGIFLAAHPPDKEHPYGHKKYETLFSLGIALLLFIVSWQLFKESIPHLFAPTTPHITLSGFIVLLITLGVNIGVMSYEYHKGKQLQSDLLIADSMHTRADIFVSCSVLLSLICTKLGVPIIDPIITILIALFIAYIGVHIARQSAEVLCDSAAILDNKKIEDIVLSINGVKSCHNIRNRGRIDDIAIDLHVEVDPQMHIEKAHALCNKIEDALKQGIPGVNDVIVHLEPLEKKQKK